MAERVQGDEIIWRLLDLQRRMHQQFEAVAAEFSLTTAEAGALRRLDQPYSMRSLAEAIGCDASYVTILTDRLDALGLVERVPDESDRRVRQLVLTDKGRQVQRALTERVIATSPALAGLDGEGEGEFLRLLRSLGVAEQVAGQVAGPVR
jgi:DNA-binding MarR family transcriptional regulator